MDEPSVTEASEPETDAPETDAPGLAEPGSDDWKLDHDWRRSFTALRFSLLDPHSRPGDARQLGAVRRRAWFRFSLLDSEETQLPVVDLFVQRRRADGEWGRISPYTLGFDNLDDLSTEDRELVGVLTTVAPTLREHVLRPGAIRRLPPSNQRSFVPKVLQPAFLPQLCATGRLILCSGPPQKSERTPLRWDPGPPWTFRLVVERLPESGRVRLAGRFCRGSESRPVGEPELVLDGVLLAGDLLARCEVAGALPWIWQLRAEGDVELAERQLDAMLEELWNLPVLPEVEMPPEWPLVETEVAPRPRLVARTPRTPHPTRVALSVGFDYDGLRVDAHDPRRRLVDRPGGRVVPRDAEAEEAAIGRLLELGAVEPESPRAVHHFEVATADFPEMVLALLLDGWVVEAEGRKVRPPGTVRLSIDSRIDWFGLRGHADFGGIALVLPELILAIRKEERLVRLGDGTVGVLPQEWLERYGPLAELATDGADGLPGFLPSQALFVEALLDGGPEVRVDRRYEELRRRLRTFDGVAPCDPPRGFDGELRPYQRRGLGWLRFLEELHLGGCLADDMGLGKTVQVLAQLLHRRRTAEEPRPSLVVVPRSLVHNWVREAARFTPGLDVLPYRGPGRSVWLDSLAERALVVTTYGTLRRDVERLAEIPFDYVVLDEAQAIKNPASQTAKACRRLDARHRLALTGTPVENHLGDLWSIFAFLNPGMLGNTPALDPFLGEATLEDADLAHLAGLLRPFLLRRTKEEVLTDLPAKTEQLLRCELATPQRRRYDELLDHYRRLLDRRLQTTDVKRSKIKVMEALLRLRQAACHPGLIDAEHARERSAKLDLLLGRLEELVAEGHKALVFSQFTSFLAIVRERLDRRRIPHEYLDGSTRDRQERVERFQGDPAVPVFLISLKAGGVGLNLTAADYVFLLDPWWNPATESQAVDRAHRLGQERPVHAYRLIAADTVEEKILHLQAKKRHLADGLLAADRGPMESLTAEELHWLLS